MRYLVVLIIHLIAILAQLLDAESLLLKHQLLIVNRTDAGNLSVCQGSSWVLK
jgi:hypothetical protein